jgi:hypothetical protein
LGFGQHLNSSESKLIASFVVVGGLVVNFVSDGIQTDLKNVEVFLFFAPKKGFKTIPLNVYASNVYSSHLSTDVKSTQE